MWQDEDRQHWIRRLKAFFWICMLLALFSVFILELKHVYNINLLPNVNGPLDDIYFKLKDLI